MLVVFALSCRSIQSDPSLILAFGFLPFILAYRNRGIRGKRNATDIRNMYIYTYTMFYKKRLVCGIHTEEKICAICNTLKPEYIPMTSKC